MNLRFLKFKTFDDFTNATINNGDVSFIEDLHKIYLGRDPYDETDLSSCITGEEFSPVETAAYGAIQSGSLGTINGQSIESGNNVTLDLSLYRIVAELPTENILDNKVYVVPTVKETNETEFTEYIWTGTK